MANTKNRVNTFIMKCLNIIQYPIMELWYHGKTIPVVGGFERFGPKIKKNNYGDDLNVFFVELLSQKHVIKAEYSLGAKLFKKRPLVLIGSILEYSCNQKQSNTVWGAGFKYAENLVNDADIARHKYLAVRGKKTRQKILDAGGQCPEVYGDPVLLISKFVPIKKEKKIRYGVIPHKLDYNLQVINDISQRNDVRVIDIFRYKDWISLLNEINECEVIISSSLHGIIIADSYEIPNLWVRFSDFIDGGGFKFEDYYSGVNKNAYCLDLSDGFDSSVIDEKAKEWRQPQINNKLLKTCPFI